MNEKTWLFDIDHTLYPHSVGVEDWFIGRMTTFIGRELGQTAVEARATTEKYYNQFGSTLTGLMYYDNIDVNRFMSAKGLVPLDLIERNELALATIKTAPNLKIAFTNASNVHGDRVLTHLGLRDDFAHLFGINDVGFWGKPFRASYDLVINSTGLDPKNTIFFEDSVKNLAYAKHLGMKTILIAEVSCKYTDTPNFVDAHVPDLVRALEVANEL